MRFDLVQQPRLMLLSVMALFMMGGGIAAVRAQGAQNTPSAIELKIDLVISRTQGDKKISSLPFTLFAASTERGAAASVRMGVDVPVGATTSTREGSPPTTTTRPEYRHVGTQIDCTVNRLSDGRYSLAVRINDSAIFSPASTTGGQALKLDPAAFKSFSINNTRVIVLGRQEEFGRAADPITGEVVRVDVVVTVAK